MLISDSHKLILMLPEKCATSTVQMRFKEIRKTNQTASRTTYNEALKKRLSKHVILKDALKMEDFLERSDYLKACFVRNPYDRIYSLFNWIVKSNNDDISLIESGKPIRGVSPEQTKEYAKKTKRILSRRRKLEAIDYDFNRHLPRKAKRFRNISAYTHHKGVGYMDFIGRIETFEEDFAELCRKIGYQPPLQKSTNVLNPSTLETANDPDQAMHLSKYSPKSIRIVNRICAADFEHFGYTKVSP